MPNLILDSNHQYFSDGVPIPSYSKIVSEIMGTDFSHVDEEYMEYKRELGTQVHKCTELLDTGTLDSKTIHDTIKPYFVAYTRFISDYKPIVKVVEGQFLGCDVDYPDFEWGCTIDRVMEIKGEMWIIDIKTGNQYREHRLQTASYKLAYDQIPENPTINKRASLYLSENGYKLKPHEKVSDLDMFLACLRAFYFKKPRYKKRKVELWD